MKKYTVVSYPVIRDIMGEPKDFDWFIVAFFYALWRILSESPREVRIINNQTWEHYRL